ncbi:MAG: hypothetical protein ACE5JI_03150 [Acidobacteriota bacterium]
MTTMLDGTLVWVLLGTALPAPVGESRATKDYRLVATNKTSTMERELNEAAAAGFAFEGVMGGDTAFGGQELVVVLSRDPAVPREQHLLYKVLATRKTSTIRKELNQAASEGYEYRGQTVYDSAFGGREVVVILERDPSAPRVVYEYDLLATNKTSTMQKELDQAGAAGFEFLGVTVGETLFGNQELVVILRRPRIDD